MVSSGVFLAHSWRRIVRLARIHRKVTKDAKKDSNRR